THRLLASSQIDARPFGLQPFGTVPHGMRPSGTLLSRTPPPVPVGAPPAPDPAPPPAPTVVAPVVPAVPPPAFVSSPPHAGNKMGVAASATISHRSSFLVMISSSSQSRRPDSMLVLQKNATAACRTRLYSRAGGA